LIDENQIIEFDRNYAIQLQKEEEEEEEKKFQNENNPNADKNLNSNLNQNNQNKNTIRSNHIDIEMQNIACNNKENIKNNSEEIQNNIQNESASNKQSIIRKALGKSVSIRSAYATQKIKINLDDIEKEYILKEGKIDGEINPNDPEQIKELVREMDLLLPRKLEDGKLKQHGICSDFGWFCCGEKFRKSAIESLGVGTDCYFKVLKVFIVCFLLISLINIPLFFVYYNNTKDKIVTNYRDALFKFTIGNIASSK